jgi:probable F420-dependent oxidoreductase
LYTEYAHLANDVRHGRLSVKFGLLYANTGAYASPDYAVELATAAEDAGFESIWAIEHVVVPVGYNTPYPYSESGKMGFADDADFPEPLTWLAYVAAATTRIRLCTGVLVLPQRHPIVLAKTIATLDHLSGGRVTLGLGVGWLREEFAALDVPFEKRGRRMDEGIEVLRALWTGESVSHHGEAFSFENLMCRPRPVQGRIPLIIGGHSEAAARRAGRVGDGFFPGKGDLRRLIEVVDETAREHGRDPSEIQLTAGMTPSQAQDLDRIRRLQARNVKRVLVPVLTENPTLIREQLAEYGERIIGPATATE